MSIQRIPGKASFIQEPPGACRVLAVRGEFFENHDAAAIGGMDSDSWELGYRGHPLHSSGIALAGEQRCLGTTGPQTEAESPRNALAHFKSEGPNSLKEKHLRTTFRRYTFGIRAIKGDRREGERFPAF